MGDMDKYFDEAKALAEKAGDVAKTFAGDVAEKARELADEDSKARELAKSVREQTASLSQKVTDKVQGVLQNGKAVKELDQGLTQLEGLPEIDGSILYRMELETAINYLKKLKLIINDNRIDDASAEEEIRKIIDKVQPSDDSSAAETDEQQAIEKVNAIVYNACTKALETYIG